MAHTPYHMTPFPIQSLSPEEKAQRTKEQKEARLKAMASVTQEQIQEAVRKLDAGEVKYQMPNLKWEGKNKWGKDWGDVFEDYEKEMNKGEIIELQKIHYGASSVSELLDRSFNEITKTRDNISPENFFNLYHQLFYNIPKDGKQSHTSLIEESTDYIGGYEDPKGEKVNQLIERVVELEQVATKTQADHPLFRNGTVVHWKGKTGIMQEGKLRRVETSGDPSPYEQIKKTLGLKKPDGKPLSNNDSWTRVSSQTWESLPKWPQGTRINEAADWSLTLSQFNVAASNITIITDSIEQSELDSSEISFLVDKLQNKIPFEDFTIEDNFDGTITYTDEDLAPFTHKGTWDGQEAAFYIGYHERLTPMSHLGIKDAIKSIIEYWEARDDKGLYDLNIFSIYVRKEFDYGEDWKSWMIQNLEKLGQHVENNNFHRYVWGTDWERSFNQQTLEGVPIFNGKMYWIKDDSDRYKHYARRKVKESIEDQIAIYGNFNKLDEMFRIIN